MCETERTGTRTSVNEIVVIRVQSAAVARRRRARRDRATRQYACQAAWFEAGADGPGHYGRQCPSSGGWFYGARSTATYCRPACRVAAHKKRTATRNVRCPACGKPFQTQGWRRRFRGDACRVRSWRMRRKNRFRRLGGEP